MIVLGIETSCDETSVAVVKNQKILSNVVASSQEIHAVYGGVVPEMASRAHVQALLPCLDQALQKARVSMKSVDWLSCTGGPGLLGSLLVGMSAAKSLALLLNKPIVYVDHVLAHAFATISHYKLKKYPILSLIVSGGHTLLVKWSSPTNWQILGRTLDDAAGEAFDKVGKMMGLAYPGGPEIDRRAKTVHQDRFVFPRPMMKEANWNFSFSGLKTAVLYQIKSLTQDHTTTLSDDTIAELSYSFQEAAVDVLAHKALRCARETRCHSLVLGGGVSLNSRLRARLQAESTSRLSIYFPPLSLCSDNAAMIAAWAEVLVRASSSKRLDAKMLGYKAYSVLQA